jgi:hypothetical protein
MMWPSVVTSSNSYTNNRSRQIELGIVVSHGQQM